MRYVRARIEEHQREVAYRIYVTDCLQNIPQNKFYTKRYADTIVTQKVDTRSGEEIAAEVIRKAGLILGF